MRASKSSSSNLPVLLGLIVLVLGATGGALWMLMDEPSEPEAGSLIGVADPVVDDGRVMQLAERPPSERVTTSLAVPSESPVERDTPRLEVDDGTPRSFIEGLVMSPEGTPVENASLRIYKGNPLINVNFPGTRQRLDATARSDAEGRFLLEDVPVGKDYVITAEHPDYATSEVDNLRLRKDEPLLDVVLRMAEGATVGGLVLTDAEAPIADARVELYDSVANAQLRPAERRPWRVVFSDATGRFEFDHISASNLRVRVEAAGYESQVQMLSYALEAQPRTENLTFKLGLGHLLPGRVVDDLGAAVPEARVEATSLTKSYQGNVVAFSDDGGYFGLDGMGEHFYQVRVTAEGYSDKVRPKVHINDGDVLIEMQRRVGVEGWVRTVAGEPVPDFRLTLMRAAPGRPPARMADSRRIKSSDGAFTFDNLDPGSFALEASADGYAPSVSERFSLERDGSPPPQLIIELSQGATLRGRVTDPQGKPLAGALVKINPDGHVETPILQIFSTLSPSNEVKIQRRTNGKGEYVLRHIMPGTYQVRVDHPEWAPRILDGVVLYDDALGTNAPLELSMPPGASISGRALDPNRRPMPFTEVQISMKNGFMEAATTDRDGVFRFPNLSEGQYTLSMKPERSLDDDKPLNPLMTLVYASKSRREVFVAAGQSVSDFELYLPSLDN